MPPGTKWAKALEVRHLHLKAVNLSHSGSANLKEKTIWLEGVKLNLNNPKIFLVKMMANRERVKRTAWPVRGESALESSPANASLVEEKARRRGEAGTWKASLRNKKIHRPAPQFLTAPPLEGSKIEKRLVITLS